jgi:hypothetical protein
MNKPSPSTRDLALRLLAVEAASKAADARVHEAVRVSEKLRVALTRFAGPAGFASLLRRAVALACAEIPALRAMTTKPDGSLEGLEMLVANSGPDAAVAILTNLLELLITFIGAPLTLRLVSEVWPGALLDE